jgi:predicted dehydrogenase
MKFGLLGLGSIGMRHARNLQMLGHKVIGYDIDMKKRLALGGILYERDELIETSDAIVIATPTQHHYRDLLDCVGVKPTFIEKPLVALKNYNDIIALRNVNPINRSFIGYMLRFHPCVKAAKNWIDQGHIGKPIWASFICGQFNDKPDYLRDGVILNWSHEIDLALYLLGPAKVVAASVHCTDGKDDIADFVLEHESGARSTIHLDYVTKNEIREGWIVGSEKNIGMDMLGRRNSMGKIIQEFGGDWNADYIDEMQAFIDYVSGKPGEKRWATGECGLRALEICQQVRQIAGLE